MEWGDKAQHPLISWSLGSPAFPSASLLPPSCLPPAWPCWKVLPGQEGRASRQPGLQLGRFLIPREEGDFTARPWQISLQFSGFVMDELCSTAGSTLPCSEREGVRQSSSKWSMDPTPSRGLSKADLTHFKQKCIKCCISTPNMGISRSG